MLDKFSLPDFADHIGKTFAANHEGIDGSFVLIEVQASKPRSRPPGASRDPFSLFYRSSAPGSFTAQGTYELDTPYGRLPIFLVPVAGNADGTVTFQAIFS
jgi:uncharacterized protein DUF6916